MASDTTIAAKDCATAPPVFNAPILSQPEPVLRLEIVFGLEAFGCPFFHALHTVPENDPRKTAGEKSDTDVASDELPSPATYLPATD